MGISLTLLSERLAARLACVAICTVRIRALRCVVIATTQVEERRKQRLSDGPGRVRCQREVDWVLDGARVVLDGVCPRGTWDHCGDSIRVRIDGMAGPLGIATVGGPLLLRREVLHRMTAGSALVMRCDGLALMRMRLMRMSELVSGKALQDPRAGTPAPENAHLLRIHVPCETGCRPGCSGTARGRGCTATDS